MAATCFTETGQGETVKAAVHGAMLTLACLCAVYNASAWCKRRGRHHAVNVAVYGALVVYECWQVLRHAAQH